MKNDVSLPMVKLRAIEPEDLDVLYDIENDVSLWNVGSTNVPYSRHTLNDYILHASDDIYTDKQVRLMIENVNGEVVGMVDVINFSPRHLRAEVGIVIADRFRKCGYASSTLQKIEDYSRDILHLHQLYAVVDEGNTASINLFLKAGYVQRLYLEDWLYDGKEYCKAVVMQKII